ncbi:DMT family transporter [Hyphomonas johnsonii]|jgi:quaternary ammonium compound-resistance protein SugE|uniref:Guanidinium exporter n=1 Tax=Hyphomonas johnsonii MHS-2 TaxID=1280950 RepID=A0A059FQM9_9PROT|nr:multidrug efflux SMR transporter [Hyphomonas johnsonii]KCZ92954.1 sugE protein- transmembrane protein [Hyphomonas johnsonii MHS-2]
MAWVYLLAAGFLEIGWAVGLKMTDGFTRPLASVLTVACMIASFGFLSLALRHLPMGTAYAVWTGIGIVGTTLVGIWLFGDQASAMRLGSIALIISGIVGLKLVA